ncbi:MAG: bifunctional phosphoserine phosphatase/homoserine phosphotransferase ThrH [Magnetospiraceae bacterium]
MEVVCLDLEGVLVPEVWINVADRVGLPELRRTTRDEPDYNVLMQYRLDILDREGLGIDTIQEVIGEMGPLEGARAFLDALREDFQVIILSDTFYEFADPLMKQLGRPTLFCHRLDIAYSGKITGYTLRMADHKRAAVNSLKALNFHVIAAGDSYNDTNMLKAANAGIFFCPPENIVAEFPQFPVTRDYTAFDAAIRAASPRFRK